MLMRQFFYEFQLIDSIVLDNIWSTAVSAIYADVVGSYVLVERSKDTILGTELVAAKVYVTVGDTNNYEVGIKKSSLTGDDRIIASSDKKIEAGDTVREK